MKSLKKVCNWTETHPLFILLACLAAIHFSIPIVLAFITALIVLGLTIYFAFFFTMNRVSNLIRTPLIIFLLFSCGRGLWLLFTDTNFFWLRVTAWTLLGIVLTPIVIKLFHLDGEKEEKLNSDIMAEVAFQEYKNRQNH